MKLSAAFGSPSMYFGYAGYLQSGRRAGVPPSVGARCSAMMTELDALVPFSSHSNIGPTRSTLSAPVPQRFLPYPANSFPFQSFTQSAS